MTEARVERWIQELFVMNELFFTNEAKELGGSDWIPHFVAEHTLRPFLRVIASRNKDEIQNLHPVGTCPCCGDAVRLALREGNGQKILHCPRCYTSWEGKFLACSHCGSEEESHLYYLTIEGDATSQIHVCKTCNGYLKVLDHRKIVNKALPSLLDIETLHLDIVAQEHGYGV